MYKINKGFIFTITLFLCSSFNGHIFASGIFNIDLSKIQKTDKEYEKYLAYNLPFMHKLSTGWFAANAARWLFYLTNQHNNLIIAK
jgi:hypothetical protein